MSCSIRRAVSYTHLRAHETVLDLVCRLLLEKAYDEIKAICAKFQDQSGATDVEVKTLLRELARVYEKDIDDNYDINWEV